MNIIHKNIVLVLNARWQAVGQRTVGKSIVDLASPISKYDGIDFDYEKDEDGNYILDENGYPVGDPVSAIPVNWETWITLPVRNWEKEDAIHYANGNKSMRCPTVIIAKNCNKLPKKSFRGNPSNEAIIIRDKMIDQYTGKKLKREDISIDHIIPRSRGGDNSWKNKVLTSREINSKKGNKLNHEVGLKLIQEPKAPKEITLTQCIRDIRHPSHKKFLPHLVDDNNN